MKKTPSRIWWIAIACITCIFIVLLIWGIASDTDPPGTETHTESVPTIDPEVYIDTSGYYGMVKNGDDKLFFTLNAQTMDKADFSAETFVSSYETDLSDKNNLSYTVVGNTFYYSEGLMLRSLDFDSGEHKTEHIFDLQLSDILVCGAYEDALGTVRITVLTIASKDNLTQYYNEIYSYNTATGEAEKLCDVNITEQNIGIRYLASDENYAYFAKFYTAGNMYRLDLKTGEFTKFASDKLITAKRLKNSFPNQAAIFENHLYFKVIGNPFGLYRANLESGEIEEYFKTGFTGNIAAFCIENGTLYAAVQSEAVGSIDSPDYRGTYSVFAIDTKTGDCKEISEKVEIANEIRGLSVEGNKALIYGSHPTFVDIEKATSFNCVLNAKETAEIRMWDGRSGKSYTIDSEEDISYFCAEFNKIKFSYLNSLSDEAGRPAGVMYSVNTSLKDGGSINFAIVDEKTIQFGDDIYRTSGEGLTRLTTYDFLFAETKAIYDFAESINEKLAEHEHFKGTEVDADKNIITVYSSSMDSEVLNSFRSIIGGSEYLIVCTSAG